MKFPLGARVLTSLNVHSDSYIKELTVDGGVGEHQYDARTAGITGTVVHFDEKTFVYLVEYLDRVMDATVKGMRVYNETRYAAYLENELAEALQLPFEEPAFRFDDSLIQWVKKDE